MTSGLPYGRGSYKGSDNYQNQQESYALRREVLSKKIGWVLRPSEQFPYYDNAAHTANFLSLARLPIYSYSFTLNQVRLRVVTTSAGNTCHTGIYVWVASPVRSFRLMSNSVHLFSTSTAGVITHDFKNPVAINGNEQYFSASFCTSAAPQLLSGRSGNATDEAIRTMSNVTSLPSSISLTATTATYTDKIILPSYYSAQAAEVV